MSNVSDKLSSVHNIKKSNEGAFFKNVVENHDDKCRSDSHATKHPYRHRLFRCHAIVNYELLNGLNITQRNKNTSADLFFFTPKVADAIIYFILFILYHAAESYQFRCVPLLGPIGEFRYLIYDKY